MITRGAGGNFVLCDSVDKVLKVESSGVSKWIDPFFGQNPRTIAILPYCLAASCETESEIRSTLARMQAGFDRQFAADGCNDRGKLSIKPKIEIALGTFAQTVQ